MKPERGPCIAALLLACFAPATAAAQGSAPATDVAIGLPGSVVADRFGNVYIGSQTMVFKLDPQGGLTAVAGSGGRGFAGDGGPATQALLDFSFDLWREFDTNGQLTPGGLAVDWSGNLYIADVGNNRVRKVDPAGIISTVAGTGAPGSWETGPQGNGGPATSASLWYPHGLAADPQGNLYIADGPFSIWGGWDSLRKVTADGVVREFVGNTGCPLCASKQLAADLHGNLYVPANCRVNKISPEGTVTVIAGSEGWSCGYSGDGGPATSAKLHFPSAAAVDVVGNVYIADTYNHCIRKVDLAGNISRVAGICTRGGYSGDGGLASEAQFHLPFGIAVNLAGELYIADTGNARIRAVATDGRIASVAGNGGTGVAGSLAATTVGIYTGISGDIVRSIGVNVIGSRPTGSVTFKDGSSTLGTVELTPNADLLTSSARLATQLAIGLHSISATYNGDAGNAASDSRLLELNVTQVAAPGGSAPPGSDGGGGALSYPALLLLLLAWLGRVHGQRALAALAFLSIGCLGGVTTPILAASDPQQLDEVIISARRIDERLLDVPISAAVVSGVRLDDAAVTRWEDLTLPGIKIGPAGIMDVLSIRGMASGINFGFEQSAPVFIDGVWFGSSRSSRIGFLDTDRVEILKGPQPIYFGKNAIAGAFGIVTRKPQPEFSASLEAYREFAHEETAVTGLLNIPLGERVATRFAGRWRDLDGYMTNSSDGSSSPRQKDVLGRVALRWHATDALNLDGKLEYSNNLTTGREIQHVRCVPQAFSTPRLLNPAFEDCRMDSLRAFRFDPAAFGVAMTLFEDPGRPGERIENELLSGLVAAELKTGTGYSIRGNVAYYDHGFLAEVKQDNSWNQRSLAAYDDSGRLFSQELRIDTPGQRRWFATLGGYHEEVDRDNAPFTQLALQLPANQARTTNWHERSESWALFAEAGLKLAETLTARAAGRHVSARRGIEADLSIYQLTPNSVPAGPDAWSFAVPTSVARTSFIETRQTRQDEEFTPAVSLEWRPRSGQMYYVSWREGFKAGGFSSFLAGPIDRIGFDPETVQYWEAGAKLGAADGSWEASAAVFDGDYRDLQVSVVDPGTGVAVTRNAGGAFSRGLDLQFAWAFAPDWRVATSVYYLDARYRDFRDASCYPTPAQTIAEGCVRTGGAPLPADATVCQGRPGVTCAQDLSGFRTSFAPRWSGSLSLQYRKQVTLPGFGGPLTLSAGVDLTSTQEYYTIVNGAPGSLQDAFSKLDARVALGAADERWEAALVGRNLTDETYGVWYEPLVGAGPDTGWFTTTARPRQLALQLRFRF